MNFIKKYFFLLILLALVLASCGFGVQEDLMQAADVIQNMVKPQNLSRSAFYIAFPDGAPSDFVRYIFSDLGQSEWPPSEASLEKSERDEMKASGTPMLPKNVDFVARYPDPNQGRQVVVKSDDTQGIVIVEAYADPTKDPVFVRNLTLMKVEPVLYEDLLATPGAETASSDRIFGITDEDIVAVEEYEEEIEPMVEEEGYGEETVPMVEEEFEEEEEYYPGAGQDAFEELFGKVEK